MTTIEIVKKAAEVLDNKKALDVKAIKIEELTTVADYFVIATGTSTTHVRALADEVEFQLKQEGVMPHHTEGFGTNYWILLDYLGVVVHIFCEEGREFYDLERLWKDAEEIDLNQLLQKKED